MWNPVRASGVSSAISAEFGATVFCGLTSRWNRVTTPYKIDRQGIRASFWRRSIASFCHRGDFAKMARKPVIDTVQSQEREEHHQHDHFRHAIPLSLFEASLLDHGWQFKGLCRI